MLAGPLTAVVVQRHRAIAEALARVVSSVGPAPVTAEGITVERAVDAAEKMQPDVAIVDLDLSADSDLIAGIAGASPETRVIVMADRSLSGSRTILEALQKGAVGIIYKEASLEELARALRSSVGSPVLADEAAGMLLSAYLDSLADKRTRDLATIEALAAAAEVRDLVTGRHLQRVASVARRCLESIDAALARNEEVAFGFVLHDIGKIGIPDAVLNKPGPLSNDEWEVMRRHPELGVRIVDPIGFSAATTDVILHHHERWDGTGYPARLRGEEVPITARAFAVADAYDAMTSNRPYRKAMSQDETLRAIEDSAGRAYDPDIVGVLVDLKEGDGLDDI